jgi:hypothetical protein
LAGKTSPALGVGKGRGTAPVDAQAVAIAAAATVALARNHRSFVPLLVVVRFADRAANHQFSRRLRRPSLDTSVNRRAKFKHDRAIEPNDRWNRRCF